MASTVLAAAAAIPVVLPVFRNVDLGWLLNYEVVRSAAFEQYTDIADRFATMHQNPLNVLMHLVTTPLGLIGALGLLAHFTRGHTATLIVLMAFMLSLVRTLPLGVFLGTWCVCFAMGMVARSLNLGWWGNLLLVALGYALQDLAHIATHEETFQASYSGANGVIDTDNLQRWFGLFLEHCYYLAPLCVDVAMRAFVYPACAASGFGAALGEGADLCVILQQPLPPHLQRVYTFAYVLMPLLVVALGSYCLDSRNGFCFFPGTPYFSRIVQTNLVTDATGSEAARNQSDLRRIRDWTIAQCPSSTTSSHWWFGKLPGPEYAAFDRIARSSVVDAAFRRIFSSRHYAVDVVDGMNEIYVSGPPRTQEGNNSDHVFFSRHVDGPLGFIPYVSVYRCIVGMDRNLMYTTHFPIAGLSDNACEGDMLGFDFNREIHYITMDTSQKDASDEFRVVLKLHYVVYPRLLAPLGYLMHALNVRYNQAFRALFLKTINPTTPYEHFLAWNVVFNTALFDFIETFLGQRSVFYILFAASLWYITGLYEVFFVMTSFVHYFRYITTFYLRKGIDFGSFKRDVLLFKTIAMSQLAAIYFLPHLFVGYNKSSAAAPVAFSWDPLSLLLIAVGYTITIMATNAIGLDRTYFGAELGLVKPKWIEAFPYGYIPHPMIVGQIIGLLGVYKAPHVHSLSPFVIPVHITLYVVHMLQEHFEIYDKNANVVQQWKVDGNDDGDSATQTPTTAAAATQLNALRRKNL